jgi:acyl carrier protein
VSVQERIRLELTEFWQQIFGIPVEEIDGDEGLFAIGGTSLQAVQLMTRMEEAYGVTIPLPVVYTEGSVNRLAELIEEELLATIEDGPEEEASHRLPEQAAHDV